MTTEDKGGDDLEGSDKQDTLPADAKQKDGPEGKAGRSDWIPRQRFDEVVGQVHELKRKVEELTKPPVVQEQPREFTRADLAASVEKGTLTQEQANDLWERQLVDRTRKVARETATEVVTINRTTGLIDAEMRRYKELVPDVMREGTEARDKVAEEYRYLVDRGHPENRTTELAALRAAYGPIEKLEKAKSRSKPDVHSDEQSGGGGDDDTGGDNGPIKGLTAREREYYKSQISKGRYKDWDAVKEELKHANTALRRKMGAKA